MVEGVHANMEAADFLSLCIRQIERWQEDLDHAAKTLKHARFKSKAQFEHKFRL
jgi:hypothetical protein